MKYNNHETRLKKLAKIYVNADSIDEYKCEADVQNISRKNYLGFLDPIMLYWIVKTYGQWTRFAVGIGFQAVATALLVAAFGLSSRAPLAVGACIGVAALLVFDIGKSIGSNAIAGEESNV